MKNIPISFANTITIAPLCLAASLLLALSGAARAHLPVAPEAAAAPEPAPSNAQPSLVELSAQIEREPKNARALSQRSAVYLAQRDAANALADAEKLVALAPRNPSALVVRGKAKVAGGDFDGAIADYTRSIEMAPTRALRSYVGRGHSYSQKGEMEKALADFDKAFELESRLVSISLGRANVYEKQKDWKKAIALYSQIVERIPATRADLT